jgi:hypothetical protein
MSTNNQILLPSTVFSPDVDQPITGEKFKGAGFYGLGYGLHTVSYQVTDFVGTLKIQASLATLPDETDWFDVSDSVVENLLDPITEVRILNFAGNFVWVRAVVDFSAGSINKIILNY